MSLISISEWPLIFEAEAVIFVILRLLHGLIASLGHQVSFPFYIEVTTTSNQPLDYKDA